MFVSNLFINLPTFLKPSKMTPSFETYLSFVSGQETRGKNDALINSAPNIKVTRITQT